MSTIRMSDGCELFYRLDGDDALPVLVFSNPHGFTHRLWDVQAEALADRFRVLRYDNRGHGASTVPPAPYTLERIARDAQEVIQGLGLKNVNFCGLSIGGMVGMWLAAHEPEVIGRMVLANTSAFLAQADHLRSRLAAIEQGGMAAVVEDIVERSLSQHFRDANPAAADQCRAMVSAVPPVGYIGGGHAVLNMDLRGCLAAIHVPVLVIAGCHDNSTPVAMGEYIARSVPDSRMAVLESAHLSNIEQSTDFNDLLISFFSR